MGHGRAGCGCLAGRSRSQKSPHWIRQRLCESALRHKDEITQDSFVFKLRSPSAAVDLHEHAAAFEANGSAKR